MVTRLGDVLGQAVAAGQLTAAVAQGRLHHGLLFAGPEGVGKFTCAKLLAQSLQCAQSVPGEACGTCPSCVKLTTAGHADILFLLPDEKDSIKVDAVREATQALHLRPIEGRFRVLIIRKADRMNTQAQNALLKTLEEPPGAAHLILTTSQVDALLPTVRSRCLKVPFHPVPTAAIVDLLMERRGIEKSRAQWVAALAQGAPGLAMEADPDRLTAARDRVIDLDRALSPGAPGGPRVALREAEILAKELEEPERAQVLDLLGVWLRDQLLLSSDATGSELANTDRKELLWELATARGSYEVLRRARALETCKRELASSRNLNTQLVLERFCLELAAASHRQTRPS